MKIKQIIKEYETPALDVVDATDTYAPPSKGYAIRVLGPLGQRSGTPAATLWYGLTELFPRDYPPANFQSYEARPSSPQSRILDTVSSQGSAVIKSGIASRDLAETLANKLAKFRVTGFDASAGPIPMSNIEVVSQNMNEAYDPGLSSKLISAGTKVAEYIFIDKGIRDRKFRIILELDHNISEEELQSHHLYLLRPPNNMGVARSRELLEWMASKGSELNYDKSNPIDFQITIPGSAAYSFNIVKVLRGTNESVEEGIVDTVKDKYARFKDYFDHSPEAVERKLARLRASGAEAQPGANAVAPVQQSAEDPYMILGIQPGADSNAIKLAYRRLAKQHHPDAGGNATEFQKIKAAFNELLASGAVIREGTAGLPDPQNFSNDNDYRDALDAYGKPQAMDADYENMISEPNDWFDESREKIGNMDADAFDDAISRLKKLAGAGPLRTVYDPNKRVYRNVPHAVQPAQQPKKAR